MTQKLKSFICHLKPIREKSFFRIAQKSCTITYYESAQWPRAVKLQKGKQNVPWRHHKRSPYDSLCLFQVFWSHAKQNKLLKISHLLQLSNLPRVHELSSTALQVWYLWHRLALVLVWLLVMCQVWMCGLVNSFWELWQRRQPKLQIVFIKEYSSNPVLVYSTV